MKITPARKAALARLYGLSDEEFLDLLEASNHSCAICERLFTPNRPPQVEHDHLTGEILGLVCRRENYELLGIFGRDPAFYRRVAEFLESPPARRVIGIRRIPGAPPPQRGPSAAAETEQP